MISCSPVTTESELVSEEDDGEHTTVSTSTLQMNFVALSYRLQSLRESRLAKVAEEVYLAQQTAAAAEAVKDSNQLLRLSSDGGDEDERADEHRPMIKVSKTIATMAPTTDLLKEYFDAAIMVGGGGDVMHVLLLECGRIYMDTADLY